MADRIALEHVVINGSNNPHHILLEDEVEAFHIDNDFDVNEHLFALLMQLKNIDNEDGKEILIHAVNNLFRFFDRQIDPTYIDPTHEAAFGTDEAGLFAVIDSLENIEDDIAEQWIDKLSEILISDIEHNLEQDNDNFDLVHCLKLLLKFNEVNPYLNALVLRATKEAFSFADLQRALDINQDVIDLLLTPRILLVSKELGLNVDVFVKLWDAYSHDRPLKSILNLFSIQNKKHLLSESGSIELFEELVMADCFDDSDLRAKLQDHEHFKMLTSKGLKFLVNMGFESLEFFAAMASRELQYFLSQNDLNLLLHLIADRKDALEFLSSAAMQSGAETYTGAQVIQDIAIKNSGCAVGESAQYSR